MASLWNSVAVILGAASTVWVRAADPVLSNVRAAQRPGTFLVDITYDLRDADSTTLAVSVSVSDTGGASYAVPASSFSGDVGGTVTPGNGKRIVWDAGKDWPDRFSANVRFQVTAQDAPDGMVLIPAGTFQMGDALGEADAGELPVHTVTVSSFYMDRTEVTKALWDGVRTWALANGYRFDNPGSGKAGNHPVHSVGWYDVVKWCNARSEREGRAPAYYTDAGLTAVYRTGRVDVRTEWVRWEAGYRLPTEAEWEYAARGGLSGRRFPWGDTISHSQANYRTYWDWGDDDDEGEVGKPWPAYDLSPFPDGDPTYAVGSPPYTSPVGSFQPNRYGLYDMAGNVWESCWDWYGHSYYGASPEVNPRGPASAVGRVMRGGSLDRYADDCRVTCRYAPSPGSSHDDGGFRSVLPPGQ